MNMIFNQNMRKFILSLIPFACAAVACNTVSMEQPVQYGTLSVALADEPSIEVQTKTVSALDKTSDEAKNYVVRVFNSENQQQGTDATFFAFQPMTLALGTYTVTAENCSEDEAESGNGKMRLAGSDEVTLDAASLNGTAEIECTVTNAKVAVEFDSSVQQNFSDLKVVLKGGTTDSRKSTGITVERTGTGVVTETYFNPSELTYTISGTFEDGETSKTISGTYTRELSAKDNIKLLVKLNLDGKISVSTIEVDDIKTDNISGEFNPYN